MIPVRNLYGLTDIEAVPVRVYKFWYLPYNELMKYTEEHPELKT